MSAEKPASVNLNVVDGVEGPSLYVNGHRVIGPKPWGGGSTVAEWNASPEDVARILGRLVDLDDVRVLLFAIDEEPADERLGLAVMRLRDRFGL